MSNQANIYELKTSFNSMVDSMLSVIQDMHQQQKDEILALIKQNLNLKTITPADVQTVINTATQPASSSTGFSFTPVGVHLNTTASSSTGNHYTLSSSQWEEWGNYNTKPGILKRFKMDTGKFEPFGKAYLFTPAGNIEDYKNFLAQLPNADKNNDNYYKYHPIFGSINSFNKKMGLGTFMREDIGGWFIQKGSVSGWIFKELFLDEMNIAH